MKLAAIFCVWHDWDMLTYAVVNIRPVVDGVIIVASEKSNYGEESKIPNAWGSEASRLHNRVVGIEWCRFEPTEGLPPRENETRKRNKGLSAAVFEGYTHFIMLDADELYDRKQFLAEKQRFIDNPDLAGLVCASRVYFKSPKLTIGLDRTLVPFIHKLTPTLRHEFNKNYPFAWEGKNIRIDPTRSLNINSGVEWSPIIMEHYSWVRKDIEIKIRNSTARANIERSTIRKDFAQARENYYCEFYGKTLIRASVDFNIPEFDVSDIQPPSPETWPTPKDS